MSEISALALQRDLPTSIFSPSYLVRRGWCTVAKDPGRAAEPHEIYYGQFPLIRSSWRKLIVFW